MRRTPTNPVNDRKIFRRTAIRTKKVNVQPTNMRGGIRM